MPNIVIVPDSPRKRKSKRREHRNVFSDETNLAFLRLLQCKPPFVGDLQLELAAAVRQRLLPWFWSILLHLTILLILAFWFFPVVKVDPVDMLSGIANVPAAQPPVLQLTPVTEQTPVTESASSAETASVTEQPADLPPVPLGVRFSSRDVSSRTAMFSGGGGGGEMDEAVLAGLRWLVNVQLPNGSWDFCGNFPQSAGERQKDALAATAMALLAFQGCGITAGTQHPQLIEFARPVRRGWDWLRKQQSPDGCFFPQTPIRNHNHRFYTHGFCTLALCELLSMTGDETLREPAQRAADYCVQHQSLRSGGWRYLPDRFSEQSDVSVTGWMVFALKTAESSGISVPPEVFDHAGEFLDSMQAGDRYKYRQEEPEPRMSMTAEALFCRILLGWRRNEPRLAAGVRLIVQSPPTFAEHYSRDAYYWFFASQTLYHYGGADWEVWNKQIRGELLRYQEEFGAEKGSWNSHRPVRDAWVQYGRFYTTCMSLYILEIPYRHPPVL